MRTRLIFAIASATLRFGTEAASLIAGIGLGELGFVLGRSPLRSLTPQLERVRRHFASHELDDVARRQAELDNLLGDKKPGPFEILIDSINVE